MKPVILFLFLYLTVFVESGLILDKLKSGADATKQTIKCGVHKFGGLFTQGKVVPCEENRPETTNELEANTEGNVDTVSEKSTELASTLGVMEKSDVTKSVDVAIEKTTEKSSKDPVTVPGGRRVITVGANCPEGYRGDGKGNCREEY